MIAFNVWYIFENKNDRRYFLDYARKLGALKDNVYPTEFLNADCLRIKINNGYVINYRTTYFSGAYDLQKAKPFGTAERDFILQELFNKPEEVKMTNTSTIRDIMEREYHKEMRQLEQRKNELIDDEYCSCAIGEQARLLATLIEANTTLKIDFKQYLSKDIMPLNVQRGIAQIEEKFNLEMDKLAHKYQELEAMLSICDNYEQKEKLLKKYGIISKK